MDLKPLPFRAALEEYQRQALHLLEAHRAGDADAIRLFHERHPRFLDEEVKWKPKVIPDSEIRDAALDLEDARLALARWYSFRDWTAVAEYAGAVSKDGPVCEFEATAEAVIGGDLETLRVMLWKNPELVRARSLRVTAHDPPVHRATLLHYVAANGVEGYRQKTPPNAGEIAKALLDAGADADALADMYGRPCTTMSMLVSSEHPAAAGLQGALAETLLDYGAAIEGAGTKSWGTPLMTALAFGYLDTAKTLARRGARADFLPAAAGLGRPEDARRLLPEAPARERHSALALAAQHGHAEIVRLLLDAGEDPNRYNPEGHHSHSTPLHQAVLGGHEAVVRLLVERGARLDIRDKLWNGTPLGWAEHCAKPAMAECLRSLGAEE